MNDQSNSTWTWWSWTEVWRTREKNKSLQKKRLARYTNSKFFFLSPHFLGKEIWVLFSTSLESSIDNFLLIRIHEQISSFSRGKKETAFGKKLAVIFRQRAILSFLAWTQTGDKRGGHGRWSLGVKRLILAVNQLRWWSRKWEFFYFWKWKRKKKMTWWADQRNSQAVCMWVSFLSKSDFVIGTVFEWGIPWII